MSLFYNFQNLAKVALWYPNLCIKDYYREAYV